MKRPIRFAGQAILMAALVLMLGACGTAGPGNDSQPPVTPPTTPVAETTQQFVARTMAGTGSIDLVNADERVIFSGCLRKNKTEDPRTMGAAAFLTNLTSSEYRLIDFAYVMDTSDIRAGESVETDVGFTVLPKSELVALNSGEELMITHRYDVRPNDRGISSLAIPHGGLAVQPDQRLSIGSVSAIFPLDGSGARVVDDARLADGSLLRVCYSATVVRADKIVSPAIVSYRSAFRDRSYVADPARTTAPFTTFRNVSARPVRVYGIGSFISNLSSSEPSSHSVDVLANGQVLTRLTLPDHVPGQTSASMPMVDPVNIMLAPGDTLTVKGRVFPRRAIVFDYAAFIFADPGLVSIDERLDVLPVDLNGDGYKDIIDVEFDWLDLGFAAGWARPAEHPAGMGASDHRCRPAGPTPAQQPG